MTVTGAVAVNIDCKNEGYELDGSKVTFTGINDPTDCIAKALSTNGIKLTSVTYSSGSDSVSIVLHKIIKISITLTHDSES